MNNIVDETTIHYLILVFKNFSNTHKLKFFALLVYLEADEVPTILLGAKT